MGEPSFNTNVLKVLEGLKEKYKFSKVLPSLSTIAPKGVDNFFENLLEVKDKQFKNGNFQFQISLHSTDEKARDWLIPIPKMSFNEIVKLSNRFYKKGDLKITLNFALAKGMPFEPNVISKHFSPEKFLIKITPLNPTYEASKNRLTSLVRSNKKPPFVDDLNQRGYDVILSIGEPEENRIGSNCGQYVLKHFKEKNKKLPDESYDYWQGESSVIF